MNASSIASLSRVATRVDRLAHYLRRPALWKLRRRGVGLDCYLKLMVPYLQVAGFRTILDIGANTGQFAMAAQAAFPNAQLFSFEPIPECFLQLQHNLAGSASFKALNCGIGNEDGELEFARCGFSASSSFLRMSATHEREFPVSAKSTKVRVPIRRLDGLDDELKFAGPLLVKIDVQGFEREVLRGGGKVLQRAKTVIVESSLETLYEGQALFDEIQAIMSALGFHYAGSFDQILSPIDGRVLQVDSIYQR